MRLHFRRALNPAHQPWKSSPTIHTRWASRCLLPRISSRVPIVLRRKQARAVEIFPGDPQQVGDQELSAHRCARRNAQFRTPECSVSREPLGSPSAGTGSHAPVLPSPFCRRHPASGSSTATASSGVTTRRPQSLAAPASPRARLPKSQIAWGAHACTIRSSRGVTASRSIGRPRASFDTGSREITPASQHTRREWYALIDQLRTAIRDNLGQPSALQSWRDRQGEEGSSGQGAAPIARREGRVRRHSHREP